MTAPERDTLLPWGQNLSRGQRCPLWRWCIDRLKSKTGVLEQDRPECESLPHLLESFLHVWCFGSGLVDRIVLQQVVGTYVQHSAPDTTYQWTLISEGKTRYLTCEKERTIIFWCELRNWKHILRNRVPWLIRHFQSNNRFSKTLWFLEGRQGRRVSKDKGKNKPYCGANRLSLTLA